MAAGVIVKILLTMNLSLCLREYKCNVSMKEIVDVKKIKPERRMKQETNFNFC